MTGRDDTQTSGPNIHTVDAHTVKLLEPWEAGRYDPPMQDWLRLPVGDECPECGSGHFGTENAIGYFPVRRCHDEHFTGCKARFRGEVTAWTISRIVDALTGQKVRLWHGSPEPRGGSDVA